MLLNTQIAFRSRSHGWPGKWAVRPRSAKSRETFGVGSLYGVSKPTGLGSTTSTPCSPMLRFTGAFWLSKYRYVPALGALNSTFLVSPFGIGPVSTTPGIAKRVAAALPELVRDGQPDGVALDREDRRPGDARAERDAVAARDVRLVGPHLHLDAVDHLGVGLDHRQVDRDRRGPDRAGLEEGPAAGAPDRDRSHPTAAELEELSPLHRALSLHVPPGGRARRR